MMQRRDLDHARKAAQAADDEECRELCPYNIDAGRPGSLNVRTDCANLESEGRAFNQEVHCNHSRENKDDACVNSQVIDDQPRQLSALVNIDSLCRKIVSEGAGNE